MVSIIDINARQVLDSRGNPTVEVDVFTERGHGSAIVPSGASTGKYEAFELRDGGKPFLGKGVSRAVKNVKTIIRHALIGQNVLKQSEIDGLLVKLDGTPNKSRLGANAILGVSLAVARAAANVLQVPLYEYLSTLAETKPSIPIPFANVINGGKHAPGGVEFQEFMIVPVKAKSFREASMMISEVYHELQKIIAKKYGPAATRVGDEGGFAPPLKDAEEALDLLSLAVKRRGYQNKVFFAIDAAASEFYYPHHRAYLRRALSPEQLESYYVNLLKEYPIISLEDPFDQDDIISFQNFHRRTARRNHFQLVGDDLLVTNPSRIRRAIDEGWCDSLLLKVNQIGTLTEALRAARMALRAGWSVMVSHRSGETEDPFIADLAVALGCGQIKLGAPARGERTAKYNQLLRIEEALGRSVRYASFGRNKRKRLR